LGQKLSGSMWKRFALISLATSLLNVLSLGSLEDLLKPTLNTTLKNEIVVKVTLSATLLL
jgi:hypothetical protein